MKYIVFAMAAVASVLAAPLDEKKISREFALELRAIKAEFSSKAQEIGKLQIQIDAAKAAMQASVSEHKRVQEAACKSVGLAENCVITGDVAQPAKDTAKK